MGTDTRIVYGMCTWWGTIYEAGSTFNGLPGCPHCGSPLFESPNMEKWFEQCDQFPDIDYRTALEWCKDKCSRALGWEEELVAITADQSINHPPIYELYLRKKDVTA